MINKVILDPVPATSTRIRTRSHLHLCLWSRFPLLRNHTKQSGYWICQAENCLWADWRWKSDRTYPQQDSFGGTVPITSLLIANGWGN